MLRVPAHPERRRRAGLRRAALGALGVGIPLLLLLALGETAVRLLVPPERWTFVDATHHWRLDPALGWVQAPNLDTYVLAPEGGARLPLRTNDDGLLPVTARREKPAGALRLLLVGDSTIVGAGVDEPQRIHAVLAEELARRGLVVDAINAGTQGFATDQALLRLEQLIGPYAPDVVLHCVTANDLVANRLEQNHGLNKPTFRVDAAGHLEALPFRPSERVRAMGTGPAKLIQYSALYRLLQPRIAVVRARLGGWEERHLAGVDTDWYADPASLERVDWELFGALVARMHDLADAHGALFLVYLHPELAAVWDPTVEAARERLAAGASYDRLALERRVGAELERRGIPFLPLVAAFAARQERGPFHLLPRDPHCNAAGYRLQATLIADFLLAEDGLALSARRPPGSARWAPAAPAEPRADRAAAAPAG
jgi:lysophospholipase L1-like esterase